MRYCYHCMQVIEDDVLNCPFCGTNPRKEVPVHHLMPGTVLNDKFLVGQALGEGGFGITYIGRDLNLDMIIAIKEYYPNGYVNRNNTASPMVTGAADGDMREVFEQGKDRFIKEARILAKFANEPGIVNVRDFFETNNTAYIIMEYLEGKTLKAYLKEKGILSADEVVNLMLPMIRSLKKVHQQGLIHRDIAPDNIMITSDSVKLLDFGAARDVSNGNKSLSVMLKPGFAPEEQYRSRGQQGPWTDIYAICATMYKCITKVTPDDSTQRLFSDEVKRPSELGIAINPAIENAIMKGMSVRQQDRYQNVDELINGLSGQEEASEASDFIPYSQMGTNVEEINITGYNDKKSSKRETKDKKKLTSVHKSGVESDEQGKFPTKKIIIASIIGVLVIGIGIILAISLGKSDKDDPENPINSVANGDSTNGETTTSNMGVVKVATNLMPWSDEYYLPFTLEGTEYSMPFDFSKLFDDGWVLSSGTKDAILESSDIETLTMIRNGRSFIVSVYNPSSEQKALYECKVYGLSVKKGYNTQFEIAMDGDNLVDMTYEQVVEKFGFPSDYSENSGWKVLEYKGNALSNRSSIKFEFSKESEGNNKVSIHNKLLDREYNQTLMETPVLSDKFFDYTFELDGITYQLPCKFEQFAANGWTISSYGLGDDSKVVGKSIVEFSMKKEASEVNLTVFNSHGGTNMVKDCEIVAVKYDLSQNIKFKTVKNASEYTIDEVKAAYAGFSPDVFTDSKSTQLTYSLPYSKNYSKAEFWFSNSEAGGNYNRVKLTNLDYGFLNDEETIDIVPGYLDMYEVPKSFGEDITKEIVKVDDVYYEIMAPMSEFLNHGWKIVGGEKVLPSGAYDDHVTLEKNGKFLWNVKVQNNSWDQCTLENCVVTGISCHTKQYESANIVLFGDITLGTDESQLVAVAGDLLEKSNSTYSFYKNGVSIYISCEDGKVRNISVGCKADNEWWFDPARL